MKDTQTIQTGELVELSAAGKNLQQNSDVYGLFGMIVDFQKGQHPYKIRWFKPNGEFKEFPMARYEIKKFRGAK